MMSTRLWYALEAARKLAAPLSGKLFGSVYVIGGDGGSVKVGFSRNVKKRLGNIKSNSGRPGLRVVYMTRNHHDAKMVEKAAHEILSPHRISGEWFDVTESQAILAIHDAEAQVCDVGEATGSQAVVA